MTAIPHAARALTSALGRFENASGRLLEAATGAGDSDVAGALVEIVQTTTQARASLAVLRFSDEMSEALLEMQGGTGASL